MNKLIIIMLFVALFLFIWLLIVTTCLIKHIKRYKKNIMALSDNLEDSFDNVQKILAEHRNAILDISSKQDDDEKYTTAQITEITNDIKRLENKYLGLYARQQID